MKTFLELLEQANSEIKQISCVELKQELGDDNLVIVDVRSKEIIQSDGAIEVSVNISRGMLEFHADQREENPFRRTELDPNKKIVLYCGAGGQSALSSKTLQDMGFSNIFNLTGGTNALDEAGFELKK